MSILQNILHTIFPLSLRIKYGSIYATYFKNTNRKYYAKSGAHTQLYAPLSLTPQLVELDDYTRLQSGVRIVSDSGKVVVKKYSAIGADCLIVPGAHTPTVGLPQFMSQQHINDVTTTIVIHEDVWVGARAILLSHAEVGRGAIVAAGALVSKPIPPYAVVAGCPAKVIASRFSLEQVLQHEASLYPENERMTRAELEELFNTTFKDKRSIGVDTCSDADRIHLSERKKELGITEYSTSQQE